MSTKQELPDTRLQPLIWDAQRAVPGLVINPYELLSTHESGHGVMFGAVPNIGKVVVKPHAVKARAANEAQRMANFEEIGVNTPPLQGISEGNRATYLVARRYPGLNMLGAHDLNIGIANPRLRRQIMPMVATASRGVADVHIKGGVHGDFQVKNVAQGPDGEFVAVDLEKSHVNLHGRKGEYLRAKDLYLLGASLLLRDLVSDRSPGYRAGMVESLVVAPHAEATAKHPDAAVDYERVSDALQLTAKTGKTVKL